MAKYCLTCPEKISRIFINELAKNEIQDNEKTKKSNVELIQAFKQHLILKNLT